MTKNKSTRSQLTNQLTNQFKNKTLYSSIFCIGAFCIGALSLFSTSALAQGPLVKQNQLSNQSSQNQNHTSHNSKLSNSKNQAQYIPQNGNNNNNSNHPFKKNQNLNKSLKNEKKVKQFAHNVNNYYFKKSGVLKGSKKNINFNDITANHIKSTISHSNGGFSGVKGVKKVRKQMIKQAATTYGIQAGDAHRSHQINLKLAKESGYLDKIFQFRKVMLEAGVLPPVLSEGVNSYKQKGGDVVRTAHKVYKIEFPARFVSSPPTWRTYLTQNVKKPQKPPKSALPKNKAQKKLWNHWVAEGWKMGLKQAQQSFAESLARLKRDFEGMLKYRILYEKGMISKPIIARSDLGVTGNNKTMSIDDRIFKITQHSSFNKNTKQWKNKPSSFNPYKNNNNK